MEVERGTFEPLKQTWHWISDRGCRPECPKKATKSGCECGRIDALLALEALFDEVRLDILEPKQEE